MLFSVRTDGHLVQPQAIFRPSHPTRSHGGYIALFFSTVASLSNDSILRVMTSTLLTILKL